MRAAQEEANYLYTENPSRFGRMRPMNGWLRLWIVWSLGVVGVLGFALYVALAQARGPVSVLVKDAVAGAFFWTLLPLGIGYAIVWVKRGFSTHAKP